MLNSDIECHLQLSRLDGLQRETPELSSVRLSALFVVLCAAFWDHNLTYLIHGHAWTMHFPLPPRVAGREDLGIATSKDKSKGAQK